MLNVGVVGCGYWGPNYIRILRSLPDCDLRACCDLDAYNLAKIKRQYPYMKVTGNFKEIARDPNIDALIITTPPDSHYAIAKICLEHKKHLLIEKPFTLTYAQGEELVCLARKQKMCLMVGHVYEFNPGIVKLRQIIRKKHMGVLYYLRAERVGLGPIRRHASVLWDLATHDISIALYLLNEFPVEVTALGESYLQKNIKDIIFVTLRFSSDVIYHIHASWVAPEKIRKLTVVGSKAMAVFDDVNKLEVLKVYRRKISNVLVGSTPRYSDHLSIVKMGDVYIPKVAQSEPLHNQVAHFLECVRTGKTPLTDGTSALRVVKILEAAELSLQSGKMVRCP